MYMTDNEREHSARLFRRRLDDVLQLSLDENELSPFLLSRPTRANSKVPIERIRENDVWKMESLMDLI